MIERLAAEGDYKELKGMLDKVALDQGSFVHEQKEQFLEKFMSDDFPLLAFVAYLLVFEADDFDLSTIEGLEELKVAHPVKAKALSLFMEGERHSMFELAYSSFDDEKLVRVLK